MATFAKTTYNAAHYASVRPTYPRQLFDMLFRFHESGSGSGSRGRWGRAVDLGCGTGQATVELTPFRTVVGVEPSAKMIAQARSNGAGLPGQIEYVQSAAESLPFLEDGSVDMIVSAQAAHWFDWTKLWREAARVLAPGGTLAVWGYSEFRMARYPSATPLINAYSQGSDPATSLGPHWERPGRTIVDEHLVAIPDPESVVPGAFEGFERIYYTGTHYPSLPNPLPVILRKKMSWDDLLGYLRTFSALHTYHERYPEDLKRADGDIAVRFWNSLKDEVGESEKGSVGEEVEIEWPMAVILARKT